MSDATLPDKTAAGRSPTAGLFRRALDSDIFYSFRRSRLTMVAAIITLLFFALAIAAPLIAVQNPFDPSELQLINSRIAPLWTAEPRNLPYRDSLATSHLPGWPAPISRPQSESVAKYVIVDMFAKACAGKSTKEVIADASAQLKQIFKPA